MKELTIEDIRKELEVGREVRLECIDSDSFIDGDSGRYKKENKVILSYDLMVEGVYDTYVDIYDCNYHIISSELKYFKIKKEEKKPVFDELVDLAVKAQRDGLIYQIEIVSNDCIFLSEKPSSKRFRYGKGEIQHGIDFISSLYTEIFTVESEEDVVRFKVPVESIILSNGEEIIDDVMFHRNEPYFTNGGVSQIKVIFKVLKGATVTQRKGNK